MSSVIGSIVLLVSFLGFYVLIRKIDALANPLVKFGMVIKKAPASATFKAASFTKFSISKTTNAFYRYSMDFAVHEGDIYFRETFFGFPRRYFRIPNDLIAGYVDRERGFRIRSESFEFYATLGNEDDDLRKVLKGVS